jgi:hypothetical protein
MYGIGLVVYFLATSIAQTASTPLHSRRNEFYYQNACNLMNTRQVDSRSVESIRRNEAEDVTQILVLAWILSIITNRILQNKVWQTNSFLNLSLQNTLLQSFKAIVQRILSSTKAHARHTHCDGEAKARLPFRSFLYCLPYYGRLHFHEVSSVPPCMGLFVLRSVLDAHLALISKCSTHTS